MSLRELKRELEGLFYRDLPSWRNFAEPGPYIRAGLLGVWGCCKGTGLKKRDLGGNGIHKRDALRVEEPRGNRQEWVIDGVGRVRVVMEFGRMLG